MAILTIIIWIAFFGTGTAATLFASRSELAKINAGRDPGS